LGFLLYTSARVLFVSEKKSFAFIVTFFTFQKELNRKREAKVKAELAGKQDKINEYK
jgi:hypothetical protein